ncbi:MAG: glycoside hydrolase family 127 protein [Clostridia bacterium]|nr:glycoside hydrolase family 127 protein [Clostridia bacterium]
MKHTVLQFADADKVRQRGDLAVRLARQIARLESDMYLPPLVFESQSIDTWPGDWEGRAMLSQTLTAMATGREPAALDAAMEQLAKKLNGNGFLGRKLPHPQADEQQLSGHGWLLRALCAYYEYRKLDVTLFLIEGVVRNLFLPLRETYREYPTDPALRTGGGAESGHVFATSGNWHLSTDTGCAYIPLDGLSHAYCIYPESPLKKQLGEMLEEMIDAFLALDPVGMKLQTHATLTATRGILRMYFANGNQKYLNAAKRIFDLYLAHGMTVNYENQNWFGRPEWTEPCAVVDSFMVAMQLYAATGDGRYLPVVNRILFNGMLRTQRSNGGFGCDSCVTDGDLRTHGFEAWWCCSMRGGEGLSACARYAYIVSENTVIVPYMTESEANLTVSGKNIHISCKTEYPYACRATYTVSDEWEGIELAIYIPGKGLCRFTPDENGCVSVCEQLHVQKEKPAVGGGGCVLMYGDVMLGKVKGTGRFTNTVYCDEFGELVPLCESFVLDESSACQTALQLVFEC